MRNKTIQWMLVAGGTALAVFANLVLLGLVAIPAGVTLQTLGAAVLAYTVLMLLVSDCPELTRASSPRAGRRDRAVQ